MREETMRSKGLLHGGCGLIACLFALAAVPPLAAQEAQAPDDAAAADAIVVDDEIMALVAPVALYPDPLLAVILQASMFPVDVVQADRFIERYQADQTLQPSDQWDPSLIALLNYPPVLAEMNEHLDWTQAMGDAVYDQLGDVQDSVQDLRQGALAMGVLASNDVQEVVVEEGIVQIRPITDGPIAIPQYDGAALLAALQPVAQAPADAADAAAADAVDDLVEREAAVARREAEVAQREAEVADREQAAGEAAEAADELVADEDYAAPATAYVEPAAVDPYASSYAPAQPSYAQPPVYAAPPPPVTYAAPSSSGWGTFGTFLGGAAVGGLLGYAIFDDDDNNGGNKRRNDINIQDSTIIVGGSGDRVNLKKDEKKRINAELRDRRDRNERVERSDRRDRNRQVAALPDNRSASRDRERRQEISLPQRDRQQDTRVERRESRAAPAPQRPRQQQISLPQRDRQKDTKVERRESRAAPALQPPRKQQGALADVKRPSQAKKEAERGKVSRDKAAVKRGAAPDRQVAQRGGGGTKALGGKQGGQQKVKATSDRGKKSRGNKRG
jgi:hypothetical protein